MHNTISQMIMVLITGLLPKIMPVQVTKILIILYVIIKRWENLKDTRHHWLRDGGYIALRADRDFTGARVGRIGHRTQLHFAGSYQL